MTQAAERAAQEAREEGGCGDLSGEWGGFAEYICARETALAGQQWLITGRAVLKTNNALEFIKELFEAGKVVPVIDGPYELKDVPEALRHFGSGRRKGKVVVSVTEA